MVLSFSSSRHLEGGQSKNQVPSNLHLRNQEFKFKKDGLQGMKMNWLSIGVEQLEDVIRKVVREEVNDALLRLQWPSLERSLSIEAASLSRRLRLQFVGTFPSRIFTGSKIEAEGSDGDKRLKVVLVDANSGTMMTNFPFSTLKIEAVVLKGDFKVEEQTNWTEKDFNESIVIEREGRRPLLIGDRLITFTNGEAFIDGLSFTDNSSWLRSGKFRVGIRAVKGLLPPNIGVQEAVSEAFEVKDRRGESYQKRSRPSLQDEVWRLYKIAKGGKSAKKLAADGIFNVKDFLQRYYADQDSLFCILNVSSRVWDAIISHAKSCLLSNEHYLYSNDTESIGLLFNCVLDLVGVTYDGQTFRSLHTLDKFQKLQAEKLRCSAWKDKSKFLPIDLPADWDTEPHETAIPSVGSSLDLHSHHTQNSDQDGLVHQSEPMPDSDLSQFSLPDSYGAEEYTNSLSKLTGSEQPVQVPSLLESNCFFVDDLSDGFYAREYKWVQNLSFDQSSPACTVLGEERTPFWYSTAPNLGGSAANILSAASASSSHITMPSTSSEFSVSFPVGITEPKPGWSNF